MPATPPTTTTAPTTFAHVGQHGTFHHSHGGAVVFGCVVVVVVLELELEPDGSSPVALLLMATSRAHDRVPLGACRGDLELGEAP